MNLQVDNLQNAMHISPSVLLSSPLQRINNLSVQLLALLCLLTFFSCDQPDEDEQTYSIPMIKTMISYNADDTPQTYHHTYDSQGRIVQRTFAPKGVETFRYPSGNLIVAQTHKNETLFRIDSLWLNEQGLAIKHKTWEKGQSPLGNAYVYTDTYEYNSEGYLIKSTRTDETYEIQDGNTVKQIHYYRSNDPWQEGIVVVDFTIACQFLPNSVNTIGLENKGMPFYGKQNKNLVSVVHGINPENPELSHMLNSFTYELDDQKRVIKEFSNNGKLSAVYSYY